MPAGYSGTPLVRKLGLKPGMTCAVLDPPPGYHDLLADPPEGLTWTDGAVGGLDFVHLFVREGDGVRERMAALRERIVPDGMIWVSWPKNRPGVPSAIDGNRVRAEGLAAGLVDVKVCAVDDTWSGLKFVIRKADRARSLIPTLLFLSGAAGAMAACGTAGGSGDSAPAVAVTDSGGVEIVHSMAPARGALTVVGDPVLEIGSDPEDPASLLYRVVGVEVLPDGRVALANLGDNTVRLYAPDGRLLWRAGGSGEGPGEFTQLRGIARLPEGLVGYQPLPRPAHLFDLDGGFLRSVPVPPGQGPRILGFLREGAAVAILPAGPPATVAGLQQVALVRAAPAGVDTLAILPSVRTVDIPALGFAEAQALGPVLHLAVEDTLVHASFSEEWDIGVWGPRGLVRRIRRAWEPVPVEERHRAAYREALGAAGGDDPRVQHSYRLLAEAMSFPDHHPAHARLLLGASGILWVERPQTEPPWNEAIDYAPVPPHPGTWDLFGPDGSWLTTVHLPPRFRLMWAGEDHVAGVARDALDVESVQVWRLGAGG
jgi:hypothetical protein